MITCLWYESKEKFPFVVKDEMSEQSMSAALITRELVLHPLQLVFPTIGLHLFSLPLEYKYIGRKQSIQLPYEYLFWRVAINALFSPIFIFVVPEGQIVLYSAHSV